MGSSLAESDAPWIVLAVVCGLLYLLFDAFRSFVHQLSSVRLRRLTVEAQERKSRWSEFDLQNFQLVSGALLQIFLLVAAAATVLTFNELPFTGAVAAGIGIWVGIVLVWKFILALIPEDTGEVILRALIPLSHLFYYLGWPLLFPLRRLLARIDDDREDEEERATDEEVQAFIDVGEEEGILEGADGRYIQSIVDFSDRIAREIMTPRIDVLAFDAHGSIADLAKLFSESKYSRIPLYEGSIDQITGFVHIKEIFDAVLRGETKLASELARPPFVVSESKKVSELLREFQSEHLQVAVVVDEFGGTAGIVTIEDIIEEIVGEIADEHEDEESTIVDAGDGTLLVSGVLRVDALEEVVDAELEGDDYETVAGLIFTTLGRVPAVGTVVLKNGYQFVVDRADRRRIYRVRVSRAPEMVRTEDGAGDH